MDEPPGEIRCPCGHAFSAEADAERAACPSCGRLFAPPVRLSVDPDLIPGYRLLRRIGAGGMGEIYLARQGSLDRLVAVKLLPPALARDREYVQRFLKEARAAGRLSHENIVAAVDAGEAAGRYFFVMEHVPGETLHRIIKREKRIPEGRALEIARQVARGLRHAHQNGLIHRDIKPKNLLLTPEGTVKICDFGLARELSGEGTGEESEEAFSSPAYASPEQCRGSPGVDHRSDMYSLGVTLFEMLTGRRPFGGTTARELMDKHLQERPPSPRALNPAISIPAARLVLRLLSKAPEDRFRDYDELIAAIEAAGRLPPARPTARGERPSDPAASRRRSPALWIAISAGFALAGLVGGGILLGRRSGGGSTADAGSPSVPPPPATAPAVDPEIERLLDQTLALQERISKNPEEIPAVRARWKHLMERYRDTPHFGVFAARLMEFENLVRARGEKKARELLEEAEEQTRSGRPLEALRLLRSYPPVYGGTEAAGRLAARLLEVERILDDRFSEAAVSAERLIAGKRFEEALGFLRALRDQVSASDYPRPRHRERVEDLFRRLQEAEAQARRETTRPEAEPPPASPPSEPALRPPREPSGPAHFQILRNPEERSDPGRRSAAAAVFFEIASRSAVYRAAAHFLSRPETEWNLGPAGARALEDYWRMPALATAESLTAAQHRLILKGLAQGIASVGSESPRALQLFACAHVEDLLGKGGAPDPEVMAEAALEKARHLDLWGLPEGLPRVELAMILSRPLAGLGALRAFEAASTSPDPGLRFLGHLGAFKAPSLDPAAVSDRWRKMAAEAGDPVLARIGEGLADRVKASAACEACSGQGRHPCGFCSGTGLAPCGPCQGTGYRTDEEGGRATCTVCKGKPWVPCTACAGARLGKCRVCEGKRSRAIVPGGWFRYGIDLGLCPDCSGTGSLFPRVSFPCRSCAGYGRLLDRAVADFETLPPWIRVPEGRLLFHGLRWLARHQDPQGFWTPFPCRLCDPSPPPSASHDVGATSLALMAFLSAGLGPDSPVPVGTVPAGEVVRKAVRWLLAAQRPDGHVVHGLSEKPMYEHLLALSALWAAAKVSSGTAEGWGDKEIAALREAAARALRFALTHQERGAGWGYPVSAPSTDTWVTSWGGWGLLMAREAGVEIPRTNQSWILQWLNSVTDRNDLHLGYTPSRMGKVSLPGAAQYFPHETLSASGGLVRMFLEGRAGPSQAAADRFLLRDAPSPDPLRRDYCYWHWGTVYLAHRMQRKGPEWNHWNGALLRELSATQEGRDHCTLGSWPPDDRWSLAGGRTYATAMNAITLSWSGGLRPLLKVPK